QAQKHYSGTKLQATIGWLQGVSGHQAEARQMLEQLTKYKATGKYLSPATLACVYGSLGQKDNAFACLEEACADRDAWLVDLKVDAMFEPLRSDPRFAKILERMNLPP